MAEAAEIAEIAADGVADGMRIVAEETLAAEQAVRSMDRAGLAYLGLGLVAGAAIGAFAGFRLAYKKAETKYAEITNEEIAEMRQHYLDKATALEASQSKDDLAAIVRERGYVIEEEVETGPPMAVSPPISVVTAAEEEYEDEDEPTHFDEDDVPDEEDEELVEDELEVRNIFRDGPESTDNWDASKERRKRSPLAPYVIHRDERQEHDAYDEVTFTYYEADDVLCNERDEAIGPEDRDKLIGEANLERFGHGSGDSEIVYIRNDQLEMVIEVVRSPNSYAREVHGFNPPDQPELRHSVRGRRPFDDE